MFGYSFSFTDTFDDMGRISGCVQSQTCIHVVLNLSCPHQIPTVLLLRRLFSLNWHFPSLVVRRAWESSAGIACSHRRLHVADKVQAKHRVTFVLSSELGHCSLGGCVLADGCIRPDPLQC